MKKDFDPSEFASSDEHAEDYEEMQRLLNQ